MHLRLAGALGPFWDNRGMAREGREHLRSALAEVGDAPIARALLANAALAGTAGDMDESLICAEAAIAAARKEGDPECEVLALTTRSEMLLNLGRHDEARSTAASAARLSKRDVPSLVDRSVLFLANAEIADGEIDRAEQMLAERIAAGRPERDITRVYLTHLYADCALQRGQYESAGQRYAKAASLASKLGALVQTAFDLRVTVTNRRLAGAEPAADLEARAGAKLKPFRIAGAEAAELIDELPVLAVAATQVPGTSEIRGAGELRVKESDRLAALAAGLQAMGAEVTELEDGLRVTGPRPLAGAQVDSRADHRIAMAFAVAGMLADGVTEIAGAESAAISDPRFWEQMDRFGALA